MQTGSNYSRIRVAEKVAFGVVLLVTVLGANAYLDGSEKVADAHGFVDTLRDAKQAAEGAGDEGKKGEEGETAEAGGEKPSVASKPGMGARPGGAPSRGGDGAGEVSIHDELATQISKRNMFSPRKSNPSLIGVMGDKAYFSDGQSAAAGGSVSMGKVLEVGPNWVEVEIEGVGKKMTIDGAKLPDASSGSSRGSSVVSRSGRPSVATQTTLGGDSSAGGMRAIFEKMKGMAPGEMKEYWGSLSEEQQREVKQAKSGGKPGGKPSGKSSGKR